MEAPHPSPPQDGKHTPGDEGSLPAELPIGECVVVSEVRAQDFPGLLNSQLMQSRNARFLVPDIDGIKINILWIENGDLASALSYMPDSPSVPVVYITASHTWNNAEPNRIAVAMNVGSFAVGTSAASDLVAAAESSGLKCETTTLASEDPRALQLLEACVASSRHCMVLTAPTPGTQQLHPNYTPALSRMIRSLIPPRQNLSHFTMEVGVACTPEHNMLPLVNSLVRAAPSCNRTALLEQRLGPLSFTVTAAATVFWTMLMLADGWWCTSSAKANLVGSGSLLQVHTVRRTRAADAARTVIYAAALPGPHNQSSRCCVCGAVLKFAVCVPCKPLDLNLRPRSLVSRQSKKALSVAELTFALPRPIQFAARWGDMYVLRALMGTCTSADRYEVLRFAAVNGHADMVHELLSLWGPRVSSEQEAWQLSLHSKRALSVQAEDAGHTAVAAMLREAEQISRQMAEEKQSEVQPKDKDKEVVKQNKETDWIRLHVVQKQLRQGNVLQSKLEQAVRSSSIHGVRECLADNSNVNASFEKGFTALHVAAGLPCTEVTKLLIEAGASINALNDDRETPLQCAAVSRNGADNIALLIAAGADVNEVSRNGSTPLLDACARGAVKSVEALLKHNANIRVTNRNTETPLLTAAIAGHADVIAVLLKANADPSEVDLWHSLAPLHAAARNGHAAAAAALLYGGANVNQLSKHGTPIMLACNFGHADVARVLLKHGAHVDSPWDGRTPLHRACRKGRLPLVQCLLEAGAKLNVTSEEGYTELHFATAHDNGMVELLIAAGSRPFAAVDGRTPLHVACIGGSHRVVQQLLALGSDPEAATTAGLTPLHLAAGKGHASIVELLLYYGASPIPISKDGNTPLHLAAALHEGGDTVRVLLAAGAVPDFANNLGETALHLATSDASTVKQLLRAGAHPGRRDLKGQLPGEKGHGYLVKLINIAAASAMIAHPRKLP